MNKQMLVMSVACSAGVGACLVIGWNAGQRAGINPVLVGALLAGAIGLGAAIGEGKGNNAR